MYKVDNAIIMAAGISSRFAPLSLEKPKALTEVKGEVLIERQISQLKSAGIDSIYVVVGYKAEQFQYLSEKYGVQLVMNPDYLVRNNHSSIYACKDIIKNTYICSGDNYFRRSPFEQYVEDSYYAAVYVNGETPEWCMNTDSKGYIKHVSVGGKNAWYMLGHSFWSEDYSSKFLHFLENEYNLPQTRSLFWEDIFINHLDVLKMRIRKYPENYIFEFDSLDELRLFDHSYIANTRSSVIKTVSQILGCGEKDICQIEPVKDKFGSVAGILFTMRNSRYSYTYEDNTLRRELP